MGETWTMNKSVREKDFLFFMVSLLFLIFLRSARNPHHYAYVRGNVYICLQYYNKRKSNVTTSRDKGKKIISYLFLPLYILVKVFLHSKITNLSQINITIFLQFIHTFTMRSVSVIKYTHTRGINLNIKLKTKSLIKIYYLKTALYIVSKVK